MDVYYIFQKIRFQLFNSPTHDTFYYSYITGKKIVQNPDTDHGFKFELTDKESSYNFSCETKTEREKWVDAISCIRYVTLTSGDLWLYIPEFRCYNFSNSMFMFVFSVYYPIKIKFVILTFGGKRDLTCYVYENILQNVNSCVNYNL